MSLVRGAADDPVWHRTIPDALKETVAAFPDRDGLIFRQHGIRWSWAEFDAEVDRFAAGLHAMGLEKGERVGIWAPNRPEWLVVQFATARLGLILVNVNPAYRVSELEFALNKVQCRALILADRFKTSDYVAMVRELAPELEQAPPGALQAARLPHLRWVIQMGDDPAAGMLRYADVKELGTDSDLGTLDRITETLDADDAINIQFTSGTTGNPKGATLTHKNILNNARYGAKRMGFSEQDRLCIPVPMYHCFGMVLGALACVSHGACMVFPGEAFEPRATLEAVAEEGCTACHGVPTMWVAMLAEPDFAHFDLSRLRTGKIGGAPVPMEVMRRLSEDVGVTQLLNAYGMTETSPLSVANHVDDGIEERVATTGRVMDQLEIKLVDAEGGIVPVGEQGELCTRGYSVMLGYWDDEEKTAEVVDTDGYMHTGDLGTIDERGFVRITGRVKDMLIRGGENVYPREIEEFLFTHPDVQEAQVFGVPDPKFGEEVCAWIVPKHRASLTEQDILDYCQGRISHYKVPRYVRFRDEFPLTVTGKPQKFIMREMMAKELGVEGD
jgi:fatty-acyl-CoA synthase